MPTTCLPLNRAWLMQFSADQWHSFYRTLCVQSATKWGVGPGGGGGEENGYDDVGYCYHSIMWISGSSCLVVAAVPIPMKSMLNWTVTLVLIYVRSDGTAVLHGQLLCTHSIHHVHGNLVMSKVCKVLHPCFELSTWCNYCPIFKQSHNWHCT